jgi:hypothetical protein
MRKLVLWGQSVAEYQAMFDLTDEDLQASIFEFGCGPTAMNAVLHDQPRASDIVSCDPLFSLEKDLLMQEVNQFFERRVAELRADQYQLDTAGYGGLEHFIQERHLGCEVFFDDFIDGVKEGRYIASSSPLPFADMTFQYALSSHYFFTNIPPSERQDAIVQHIREIKELARIAHEVRIFPIINRTGEASTLLGPVLLALQQADYGVEVREVPFSLYPKGNAMLRVWANTCVIPSDFTSKS